MRGVPCCSDRNEKDRFRRGERSFCFLGGSLENAGGFGPRSAVPRGEGGDLLLGKGAVFALAFGNAVVLVAVKKVAEVLPRGVQVGINVLFVGFCEVLFLCYFV